MMLSVTMSESSSGKSLTIIVNDHRAPYYLIASVPIYIDDGIVVITLSVPR